MAILGNIIKSAVTITDKVRPVSSPVEKQQEELGNLLYKARDTAFGRYYDFRSILESRDLHAAFSEHVPYHDYDKMFDPWWQRQLKGEHDVSWPGLPPYYAITSGTTTNEGKRIPITNAMLESIRKTGINQVLALTNYDLPADFYEKEVLMLGSSTRLKNKGHYLEGEISGIAASNIPSWFEGFYRPGPKISSIADWDERVLAIAKAAPDWDIGALSGIPSWIELMLKKIIDYHGIENIHQIWPNLSVFASGGVAFSPYQKSMDKLLERPIAVIDTYLASEGFLAYQARPNKNMGMRLAAGQGIYFEFVPFTNENIDENGHVIEGSRSYTLDEVEEATDYVLVISTVAGAWRFVIGDTVRFTDKERAEVIITGRTKHYLNVVGSQLPVFKMNAAMKHLEQQFDLAIPEFTVAAVRPGEDYIHHWYLGAIGVADERKVAQALDKYLRHNNKNYDVARTKALKDVRVTLVAPDVFYEWNEKEKKKGGQVKMPRVMKEDEFQRWQTFADRLLAR